MGNRLAVCAVAIAAAGLVAAGFAFTTLEQQVGRQAREIAVLESARPVRPVTQPVAACPYSAVQCATVPAGGKYGLVIEGNRKGYGGIPLMVTDYNKAPEMWMQGGSLYVLAKPGWIGGQVCIDVALKVNYCLTDRDIAWIHAHGG